MKGEEFIKKVLAGERDFSRIKLEEDFDLSGHEGFAELLEYLHLKYSPTMIILCGLSPIILNDSELKGIKAERLYLPYVCGKRVNLQGADLEGAYLGEANLVGANLREAYLQGATLVEANLEGATLEGASLKEAHLDGASLKEADLNGANLEKADLEKADLKRASFKEASLEKADLKRANLQGANLKRAYLGEANLVGANLKKAYLKRANLMAANLKEAKNLEVTLHIEDAIFNKTRVTEREKAIIEEALKRKQLFIVE